MKRNVGIDFDWEKQPEAEELSKLTLRCIGFILSEFQDILDKFSEQKSLESLAAFADDKDVLFQGCVRLLESGFYTCEGSQAAKETLASVINFKTSIASLVSTSIDQVTHLGEAGRFTFVGQLLKSEWIAGRLRSAMQDEGWCEKLNSCLRQDLPGLISTGSMVDSLKATL